MSGSEVGGTLSRARREPPPFRLVEVRRAVSVTPWLVRVTLGGGALDGFAVDQPAASVRLLLPSPGSAELVVPVWNGNECLLPEGRRPVLRTMTPRRVDADGLEADLEIVVHDQGAASAWARTAAPGWPAALSGPGRGYTVDPAAGDFLLAGDEAAIPAISQLLEVLPTGKAVSVHLEIGHHDAGRALPAHPGATVQWHLADPGGPAGQALVAAIDGAPLSAGTRVWVAGEAAAVQRIRRLLLEQRQVPRSHTSLRGYWKHGRGGDVDDEG